GLPHELGRRGGRGGDEARRAGPDGPPVAEDFAALPVYFRGTTRTNGMTMSAGYGGQTMWEPLRRVVVRPPDQAFANADPGRWHYTSRTDPKLAAEEHGAFTALLRGAGAEVIEHREPLPDHADAIYCHDPVLVTDR